MPDTLDTLKAQLVAFPSRERAELAQFLMDSLESEDDEVEAAWDVELTRRVDDIQAGRVVGEPSERVFAELRERFP